MRFVLISLAVITAYVVTGTLGLRLSVDSATLIWVPSGIALAVLYRYGFEIAPAVFLGATLTNILDNTPALVSTLIGVSNTAEAIVAVALIRHWDLLRTDTDARHTIENTAGFLLVVMISCTIAANTGLRNVQVLGLDRALEAPRSFWLTWWAGDVIGCLTIAPVLLGGFKRGLP